jgi:hypothetical protein
MTFFQTFIVSSRRDIGVLAFVDKIKRINISRDIYCLDGKPVLKGAEDGVLIRAALMENGKDPFHITSGQLNDKVPNLPEIFYVSQSPRISEPEFADWCTRNNLKASLLFGSPLVNMLDIKDGKFFRFYAVQKYKANPEYPYDTKITP